MSSRGRRDLVVHAVITDTAGNVTNDSVRAVHPRLDRPERLAQRSRRRGRRDDVNERHHWRPRRARGLLRLPGGRLHVDLRSRTTRALPFSTPFDTSTLADGLYDLRAVGYDALDNASAPALRTNVRFDNTAPTLVLSVPADGSVSTSADQIVLTVNEPVTAPGELLDGVRRSRSEHLGLHADVRDRIALGWPPRPLGRARGRQRHPLAVPRRGHDREHAGLGSAAGRAQHHLRRGLHGDHSRAGSSPCACRPPRGRRRRLRRTTSSCSASTPVRPVPASSRARRSSK